MVNWFEDEGYKANLHKVGKVHPDALSLEQIRSLIKVTRFLLVLLCTNVAAFCLVR